MLYESILPMHEKASCKMRDSHEKASFGDVVFLPVHCLFQGSGFGEERTYLQPHQKSRRAFFRRDSAAAVPEPVNGMAAVL